MSITPPLEPIETHPQQPAWHLVDRSQALDRLGTSTLGLTSVEADDRARTYGRNELIDRGGKPAWKILWEQFTSFMVLILIVATVLSLVLGKFLEAGAIGGIVVLFALLGFFQEHRAEKAIAALRQMTVPTVRVARDGVTTEVAAVFLVPGDIVHLDAGTVVPADLRLIEVVALRVQEAALTGESESVDKTADALDQPDLSLGDRTNMAFSGTQVTYGRGVGLVIATGMSTELGRIADLLQGVKNEQTPLQARLDSVGKQLAALGVVTAGLVAVLGALAGETWSDLVLTAISVAVAVIPEGLPAVVTFTLAVGAQRMLRRNALVRKLPAVETLGSVTTICSDKTGTLTQNKMTVSTLSLPSGRVWGIDDGTPDGHFTVALVAGALCNDADLRISDGVQAFIGDPTETCLVEAAQRAGIDVTALRRDLPRIGEMPFDSERKRMSTRHPLNLDRVPHLAVLPDRSDVVFVKGAVDGLLPRMRGVWADGAVVDFDERAREWAEQTNSTMAARGQRVLALAMRELPTDLVPADLEVDLILLGLVGIIDPPRPEVADAVAVCRLAGIRPVMITGDHPLTARAIAHDLGIGEGAVLTGVELDRMDDAAFAEAARSVSVFARVSPEHKLRLVESLQRDGQIVAMTGDGVNDAPALKRSDIGVAMGITGTDVSKEASDMVLRDDNFASIINAVEEGRVIYDNLRRFVSFAVAGNVGKIIVMVGWPIPFLIFGLDTASAVALLPLQLLWLNLMTDGLLGLAMGKEPAESTVMRRPPHVPGGSLWAGGLGRRTVWIGAVIGLVSLAVGYWYHGTDNPAWQSMVFTTLAFLQIGQAFATRSHRDSLATMGWRSNPLLLWIAGIVTALQLAALYTPIGVFLRLEPLALVDLAIAVAAGAALVVVIEVVKALDRRRGSVVPHVGVAAK